MRPGSQRAKPDIPTDYEEVTCSTPKGQKVTCVPITTLALLKLGRVKMAKKNAPEKSENMCWLDEAPQHGSVVTSHQGVVILVTNM